VPRCLRRSGNRETGVWAQTIRGRTRPYLGPAHGFAGNVHALRGFLSDDDLRARGSSRRFGATPPSKAGSRTGHRFVGERV